MENNKRKTKPDWNKLTAEDLQKLEIAEEIGVIDKIYAGGYGNLTSKESGKNRRDSRCQKQSKEEVKKQVERKCGIHYTKSIEIIMKKWRIQNGSRKAVK